MDNDIFEKAQGIMNARRIKAINENDRRIAEINEKIPEMRFINANLFKTSKELFGIIARGEDVKNKVEKLRRDNLEAQRYTHELLIGNGYPQDYLDMHYECRKCEDTGSVGGCYCDCFKKLLGTLGTEKMNRTAQVNLSSFETFSLEYYKDNDLRDMKRIFDFAKKFAAEFPKNRSSILMTGGTGLGKTHLSLAIANVVLSKGYSVVYDSTINILRKVEREHFGREQGDTLSVLLECDLLILDDLGTEYQTPFYTSTVYSIINTRINNGKSTVMSTNLTRKEIKKRYEERVVSRLYAEYTCLTFKGTDVRGLKKIQKGAV